MQTIDAQPLADALRAQRVDLSNELHQLQCALESGDFDWDELESLLWSIEGTLIRHLDFEEAGGYMIDVRRRNPAMDRTVQKLFRQHQEIRESFHRLRRLAVERVDRDALRREVGDWIRLMHDHESAENRLTQQVFNIDMGQGD